jgi:predicted MPP superfamily phosphohydrolase
MASEVTPIADPGTGISDGSADPGTGTPDGSAGPPAVGAWSQARVRVAGVARTVGRSIRRRSPTAGAVLLVALAGGILGAELAPATTTTIGPLQARVRVVPSLQPGVHLLLPPAGQVDFATHVAPLALEGEISQVDLEGARALIESPAQVRALGDTAGERLREAAIRATLTTVGCATLGALGLSLLVYRRRWNRTGQVALTLAGTLVVTGGMAGLTADPQRLAQPRFTGLLSQAPYIAGQVPSVVQRLETYRSGLSDIVRSVTALYATTGGLSEVSTSSNDDVITVLHVADIHLNPLAFDLIDRLVAQFGVDAVVDSGDITTWGTEVESSTFSRIGELKVPYVFVRGNHDSPATEAAVKQYPNAVVLDDQVAEVAGLVMAGIGDPTFTPDGSHAALPGPTAPVLGATPTGGTTPPSLTRSGPTGSGRSPLPSPLLTPARTSSATSSPTSSATSSGVAGTALAAPLSPQGQAVTELAETIEDWDAEHPDRPVQLVNIHEPVQLEPLLGLVPTVMSGHTHSRKNQLDPSGTRLLTEGSTGGAGITARGLVRLADGKPLPLAASLVYYARRGERAGQIVAIDAITVGGFGLTSVNLERTVVPPPTGPLRRPESALAPAD